MILKTIVVDDEPLARRVLENYIAKTPWLELIASCPDTEVATEVLAEQDVDLLFLDIRMPGKSGMEFARELEQPPMFIFVTAFPEYAAEGFELEAVDYLVKPFGFERFEKAAKKARYLLEVERKVQGDSSAISALVFRADKKLYRLPVQTILYLEGYDDYVKVHSTRTKTLLTKNTLKKLDSTLPVDRFVRIHRSYIVALDAIQFVEGNQVSVNDRLLPVSESHRKALMERLGA